MSVDMIMQHPDFLLNQTLTEQFFTRLVEGFVADFNWFLIPLILILLLILNFLISSFFLAGQTGMCRKANETGKTNLSDFVTYGKRLFIKVLAGLLLMFVFVFILFFAFIFVFAVFSLVFGLFLPPIFVSALNLIPEFFLLYLIYLMYYPVYAIVVEDRGIIDGFGAGMNFIMKNLKDASVPALIWALVTTILNVPGLFLANTSITVIAVVTGINILLGILVALVLIPVLHVIYVRLYMDRTSKYLKHF